MALFVGTDRKCRIVTPANGKKFTLAEMYALIGNKCDMVQRVKVKVAGKATFRAEDGSVFEFELTRRMWIWVDEEGLLKENVQNAVASSIGEDFIVGNALITGTGEA